ncbi:putative ATP-citrate synthase subunit 1 [Venturia nashicola]|uniref:Putative ATP-citrate synthase subunit 1 n=1 Tax=Venturia nashicola TaxID=86259 RepID=A0A4Z1NTZ1_9PEZI|nr:putative ATP-citrate synthase subunit 1 [Venturia nashicola]TLD29890.1 putative ATP-citrate synthase subunit 1 [Venturia nashicola]
MQLTLIILASLATALALPVRPKEPAGPAGAAGVAGAKDAKSSCTFSANEKSNLGHNHDVNTGMIKSGGKVRDSKIAIFGSGCSPAWAVGGDINDNTPTPTPKNLMKSKINY